jgi:endonuclease YncB( thermonuclease family)
MAAVPLNQKRRIFRPAGLPLRRVALPGRGVLFALAGALALGGGVWLALEPSQAPARPPATGYLAAPPAQVRVVDGGTLRLQDRVVRLAGIDPPARGETCTAAGGATIDCGVAAANALAAMLQDGPTECTLHGHDAAGRPLAVCVSHGTEVNLALVTSGWARTDQTEPGLAAAEAAARTGRRGLWAMPQP